MIILNRWCFFYNSKKCPIGFFPLI
jgi:hypothetical protein